MSCSNQNITTYNRNMLCLTLLLLFCVSNSNNYVKANNLQTSDKSKDVDIYQKILGMDKKLKNLVNLASKMLLPYALEVNEHLNLSVSCKRDAFQLYFGVRNLELSALKILDAAGKAPAGIIAGNAHILGDYDECMTTSVSLKNGNTVFKGKYCMTHIRAVFPTNKRRLTLAHGFEDLIEATKNSSELTQFLASSIHLIHKHPLKVGLCIPSGCRSTDLSKVLNHFVGSDYLNVTVAYCDQQDNPNVRIGRKIAILVLSIDVLLVLIGTSMDYYSAKKRIDFKSTSARLLLCFSIPSNLSKVMSIKTSPKSINSVFGVRSISLFHVVLLYECYCHFRFLIQAHVLVVIKQIDNYIAQIVLNGFLTVEVFFFLGGLLNCYRRMKEYEDGGGKLTTLQKIIHRLWRIYPAYLFIMATAFLLAHSSGPMATFAKEAFWDNCKSEWWKNILFINNFYPFTKTCMSHTWYIAADMQLFLISQFTLPVLLRSAKKGIILHLAILVAGITGTFIWAWHEGIPPSNIIYELDLSDSLWSLNSTTLPHIAPYFTGIIIAYILYAWKDVKISLVFQIIGWSLAATCCISMLFITKMWNAGAEYTAVESALYFGFSRFVYVLAVAWLIVCCVSGHGGIINYILSLKFWIPISRISYMMFLLFPILQIFYFSNLKMIIDVSMTTMLWRYMGTLAISILIALAMVLMVESPFVAMEKILFKSTTGNRRENNGENRNKITTTNVNIHI